MNFFSQLDKYGINLKKCHFANRGLETIEKETSSVGKVLLSKTPARASYDNVKHPLMRDSEPFVVHARRRFFRRTTRPRPVKFDLLMTPHVTTNINIIKHRTVDHYWIFFGNQQTDKIEAG